ncbi:partial Tyrosine recombinase XerD, partial [Geobacteraceae bacterium]
ATERLMDELKKATAGRTKGYLYTNPKTGKPYTGIRKALERAALKAGISDRIYHHLLRHCYGTYATEAGVHPRALQQMMGHEKLSTTEKYGEVKSKFIVQESRKMQKYHEENGTTPDPN